MAASREKLVRNAEKFVARGRIEAAIREYRKVLEDQPRDTGTLNRVGDLYARINRIDEAVRLFTQIAEQYTEEGFFVKAIAIYKKIIKLDPTRLSVYEKLAELYHRQGLVNEARTQYQVLADYYAKHENSTSAISIYQQMAVLEPEDPAHRVKLAELYQQGKLKDKAMEQYQLIADLMLDHGRVDQAVQVLKRGLEIDPEDLDYLARAVDKLRNADQAEAARELLTVAKEHNPAAETLMPPKEETAVEEVDAPVPYREVEESPEEADFDLADGRGEDLEVPSQEEATGPGAFLASNTSLQEALAEAEAAVPSDQFEEDLGEADDFLIGWDEEEADSLIRPPPDMAEKGPEVAGSGFRDTGSLEAETEGVNLTDSWELDLEAPGVVEGKEATEEALETVPHEVPAPFEAIGAEAFLEVEQVAADGLFEAIDTVSVDPDDFAMEVRDEIPDDLGEAPTLDESAAEVEMELDLDLDLDLHEDLIGGRDTEWKKVAASSAPEDLLSEAEVLAKYGLTEKAFQRVQEVLNGEPEHLGGLRVLIQLHLEGGDEAKVRELAVTLRRCSQERGESRDWQQTQDLFAVAGFVLDTTVKPPPRKRQEKKPTTDRIDRLLASLLESDSLSAGSVRSRQRDKALDELFVAPGDRSSTAVPPTPVAAPAPPPVPSAPPKPPASASPPEAVDLEDHSDIEDALAIMEPRAATPRVDSVEPGDPHDETGTSWLDEVEASRQADTGSSEVFEEEEGFFVDLAAELEEELTVSDALGPQQSGEQSLEEIVQGFKRGVEEQLSEEDYDTHFDLGIAYREMGLLDEAIGEFQVASKAPEHVVACCSMLGICFLEKGLPELAVKWYTRGLAAPSIGDDDGLALLYDLGSAYFTQGDEENARKTFVEVYGINSHYRDVAARLAELGEGDR